MAIKGRRRRPRVLEERSDMHDEFCFEVEDARVDLAAFVGGLAVEKRAAQRGSRSKSAGDQHIFHDGPETFYRYAELSRGRVRIMRCETVAKSLVVPERIDGKRVTEFAPGAFAGLAHVRSIVCPSAVERVGAGAFSECAQLRKLVLPAAATQTDPTWLLGCAQLDDVVLPAKAVRFDEDFLASFSPRRVLLGARVRRFAVPERWCETLREFAIDADNPWIRTDGTCIYSSDGGKLLSCAVHRAVVDVASGCREIARKAFAGNVELKSVNLSESVQTIGPSAFAGSGLIEVTTHPGLREIGVRAFARCPHLARAQLSEGIESIGEEAFAHCRKLEHLTVPHSLRDLGARAIFDTALQERGGSLAFVVPVDAAAPSSSANALSSCVAASTGADASSFVGLSPAAKGHSIFADAQGVLYKRLEGRESSAVDRLALIDASALQTDEYEALPGTYEVAPRAFYRHPLVRRVVFPDGLHDIGRLAFAECSELCEVRLPDSLCGICERAFCGAPLRSFVIPANLDYLGERALGIVESGRSGNHPALRSCRVSPGNEKFFMHDGLLCEQDEAGVRVVLYVGPETDVSLPENTCEIAPFAFAGVRGVSRIYIPHSVLHVGIAAFAFAEPCETVEFQRMRRWRGRASVVVHPPHDTNGAFAMRGVLAHPPLDARAFSEACDHAVLASRDDLVRYRYMVQRLGNHLYLERTMRKRYEDELREQIIAVCRAFFKADDRDCLKALGAMGFLSEGTITRVLDVAQTWDNVACTALLLNMKHEQFGHESDFEL